MGAFRADIRNQARPEGCIAEAYIQNECLTFCSRYLTMTETKFNRIDRNEVVNDHQPHQLSIFAKVGKPLGKPNFKWLSTEDRELARLYVLKNCTEVEPFIDEYESGMERQENQFTKWFESRVKKLWNEGDERVTEEMLCLARGPMKGVTSYAGYVVNGFRFHTKKRQRFRKTQNSGVVVEGETNNGEKYFFGVLEEVVILEYDALKNRTSPKVVLFKCKWFDVYTEGRGIKVDKFGAILVNVTRRLQTNEPFALASQCRQVFYTRTHNEPQWRLVIKTNPRNYFDFPNIDEVDNLDESLWEDVWVIPSPVEIQEGDEDDILPRDDVEPDLIDVELVDTNIIQDNYSDDEDDEDESEDEEDEFSDRESDLESLDRALEEDNSGSDSDTNSDNDTGHE